MKHKYIKTLIVAVVLLTLVMPVPLTFAKWTAANDPLENKLYVLEADQIAHESDLISEITQINVETEPSTTEAITRLEAGELDIFAFRISSPEIAQQVEASPNLASYSSYGSYSELTFNPSGPIFTGTGKLNPFAVPRVREAMNWLIDRAYIAQEIYGGLAIPRYHPINNISSDYTDLADVARGLELEYAYNKELANQVITEEMNSLGATMEGGVWQYAGEPVEIILLIRVEDERLDIGDYVGDQLEQIGFVTVRDYKTAAEASPIVISGNPADGLFHVYTGGWITPTMPRDLARNFDTFYTPRGFDLPLWQAYTPAPEFDEVAERLATRDFATIEERRELMAQALEMAFEDSVRVWISDRASVTPRRAEVSYASDYYGSISGSWLWPYTLQRDGNPSTPLNIGSPSVLTASWNPLDGTNWIYDMMFIRAIGENATIIDPYTGLARPQRIEGADVIVKEGLPVRKTLDWVNLDFASQIQVPADAWVDWDAEEQRFITAGETYPEGRVALRYSKVYYEEDLYDKVVWHDGSAFSLGDVVLGMILQFDRAKEASAIYDPSKIGPFSSFMETFRGVRILSEDPLVIETWSDSWQLDAEQNVSTWWPAFTGSIGYNRAQGAWHNTTLGIMAETQELAAFSNTKAEELQVLWMSYIAGPTLDILADKLAEALNAGYIPYGPTLGLYISSGEAQDRWDKLNSWYSTRGHLWIGTGPFYLEQVSVTDKQLMLMSHTAFPDDPDKWEEFIEPAIAEVEVNGPESIERGEEAVYFIQITLNGQPYPNKDIEAVKFMVLDSQNRDRLSGEATPVSTIGSFSANNAILTTDGIWRVILDAEMTLQLPPGANTLEVAVISKRINIPSYASQPFTGPDAEIYMPIVLRE